MLSLKEKIKAVLIKAFYLLPIKKRKAVFISNLGNGYGCNPRYLCEYMLSHSDTWSDIVWLYNPEKGIPAQLPEQIKAIPIGSLSHFYHIAIANVIVSNTRLPEWIGFAKRPKQIYVQTWHSTMRLKKIEGDTSLNAKYVKTAEHDSSMIDILLSGCKMSTEVFKRSFWYDGLVYDIGTPRIDFIKNLTEVTKSDIRKQLNLSPTFKYLLYAPTFRDNSAFRINTEAFDTMICRLSEMTHAKWKGILRLHPNCIDHEILTNFLPDWIDATPYPDMQQLLAICDAMVTDYSSSMFDMLHLDKPVILLTADFDHYKLNERDFYLSIHQLPFPSATNMADIPELIANFDAKRYRSQADRFLDFIGSFETGKCCEQLETMLLEKIK